MGKILLWVVAAILLLTPSALAARSVAGRLLFLWEAAPMNDFDASCGRRGGHCACAQIVECPHEKPLRSPQEVNAVIASLPRLPTTPREAIAKLIAADCSNYMLCDKSGPDERAYRLADQILALALTPSPSAEPVANERRVERIEHIAAIISDEYKTNIEGMLTNSHDLARMIVDAQPSPSLVSEEGREAELREALKEAIAVFESWHDDETEVELLPRLRAALSAGEKIGGGG